MKRKLYRRLLALLAAAVAVLVVLWFLGAVAGLNSGRSEEGRQQLENAIRAAAVACYAAEGIYPPTLDYLTEHYGLQINEERYTVFYEIFGENIMPEITVLGK